jgi:hypothetical protein
LAIQSTSVIENKIEEVTEEQQEMSGSILVALGDEVFMRYESCLDVITILSGVTSLMALLPRNCIPVEVRFPHSHFLVVWAAYQRSLELAKEKPWHILT